MAPTNGRWRRSVNSRNGSKALYTKYDNRRVVDPVTGLLSGGRTASASTAFGH